MSLTQRTKKHVTKGSKMKALEARIAPSALSGFAPSWAGHFSDNNEEPTQDLQVKHTPDTASKGVADYNPNQVCGSTPTQAHDLDPSKLKGLPKAPVEHEAAVGNTPTADVVPPTHPPAGSPGALAQSGGSDVPPESITGTAETSKPPAWATEARTPAQAAINAGPASTWRISENLLRRKE